MNDEYLKAREEFDLIYYVIGFLLFLALLYILKGDFKKMKKEPEIDLRNVKYTREEL